jgi:hypothetical protein
VTYFARLLLKVLLVAWSTSSYSKFLYHGACTVKTDPEAQDLNLLSVCAKGQAGSWLSRESKVENDIQPPILYRADGDLTLTITPWVLVNITGHASLYRSQENNKVVNKENQRDGWLVQLGNNAKSRHRLQGGRGKPVYRINHQQRPNLDYMWGLASFDAPIVDYAMYTYDNQLDWTVQFTYGQLIDQQLTAKERLFGSGRAMYDIAALEGTRIVLGGFGDGLLRRSISAGLLNINGKGDETALELTRSFSEYPYDPTDFNQMIRLSYISHEQEHFKYKAQYDDLFKQIRIGGLGIIYIPEKHWDIELQFGYAKNEENSNLSHWFGILHTGVHL